mmetsp:Transcript_89905/g.187957  ORF Transcript_89905/g.187957 Transcript_89905/m.187957 type:complete len:203 (-) Transcript_89905:1160-1768(-)
MRHHCWSPGTRSLEGAALLPLHRPKPCSRSCERHRDVEERRSRGCNALEVGVGALAKHHGLHQSSRPVLASRLHPGCFPGDGLFLRQPSRNVERRCSQRQCLGHQHDPMQAVRCHTADVQTELRSLLPRSAVRPGDELALLSGQGQPGGHVLRFGSHGVHLEDLHGPVDRRPPRGTHRACLCYGGAAVLGLPPFRGRRPLRE